MLTRLTHGSITLGVVLVCFQLYTLVVVPWVEPPLVTRPYDAASEEQWRIGAIAVGRYQELLKSYLPPDHWALEGKPQVYETGGAMLVLDDYRPDDRGRLRLTRCVLLSFGEPRRPGAPPPRDAIVVEAPDGATLQFEERVSPDAVGVAWDRIGMPVAGRLHGQLVIRSDMREPGAHDDLRIETHDLRLNQAMLTTRAEVDIAIGPHRGRGRGLEMRLLRESHAGESRSGVPIVGVESLIIQQDVEALVSLDALPGSGRAGSGPVASQSVYGPRSINAQRVRLASHAERAAGDVVRLTCAGVFRFDFTEMVASLNDDVRATLPTAGGQSDELRCDELRLYAGDARGRRVVIDTRAEPDVAGAQSRALSGITPHRVEALGRPVRIDSPSRQLAVRCGRLRYGAATRRMRLEGTPTHDAAIAFARSEVQAPSLEYTMPAPESGRTLGEFAATGPGWLRLVPPDGDAERAYQARWNAGPGGEPTVTLRPDGRTASRLTIVGRPEFAVTGMGKVRADRVVAMLREVAADGPAGPAIELGSAEAAILPKRVDAVGSVEFVGRQIEGRAESLSALVRVEANDPNHETDRGSGGNRDRGGNPWSGGSGDRDAAPASDRYRVATRTMTLDVGLAAGRATPRSLTCDGGVRIEEAPDGTGKTPLRVSGSQLRVANLDRRDGAVLTLAGSDDHSRDSAEDPGRGPTPGDRAGLAEIRTETMRVWVRDLHVDQAAGRAWTEGRGDAVVRLSPGGSITSVGGEATLRWRSGMRFDGSLLAVTGDVVAEAQDGWVRCQRLAAGLSRPIDLRRGVSGAGDGSIDVRTVACEGGVKLDYRSLDDAGPVSHERATFGSVTLDRQTGEIGGQGPGSIRSVRLAGSGTPFGAFGTTGTPATAPRGAASGGGLQYLRVDFRDAIAGNLHDRSVRLLGRVQTVYGPVLAWDQQLPLKSPDGVPPDSVELACDELRVSEAPTAVVSRGPRSDTPLGPVELQALGSVRIDATLDDRGGEFVAEAARASYAQAADRFVLEGDGREYARLWTRPDPAQPFVPTVLQRIVYSPSSGGIRAENILGSSFEPGGGGGPSAGPLPPRASRPTPPRR